VIPRPPTTKLVAPPGNAASDVSSMAIPRPSRTNLVAPSEAVGVPWKCDKRRQQYVDTLPTWNEDCSAAGNAGSEESSIMAITRSPRTKRMAIQRGIQRKPYDNTLLTENKAGGFSWKHG